MKGRELLTETKPRKPYLKPLTLTLTNEKGGSTSHSHEGHTQNEGKEVENEVVVAILESRRCQDEDQGQGRRQWVERGDGGNQLQLAACNRSQLAGFSGLSFHQAMRIGSLDWKRWSELSPRFEFAKHLK